uniref:Uncharacterized protein n=1 Tax=Photinus pyralis TaxID=7054 RepID=A0A1Y1K7S9_PHOPY
MACQFKHPFSAIIAGPSACGKSEFIVRFLQNSSHACDTIFEKVYWFYDQWQSLYSQWGSIVEFQPDMNTFDESVPVLIVIDDLMRESNKTLAKARKIKQLLYRYINESSLSQLSRNCKSQTRTLHPP